VFLKFAAWQHDMLNCLVKITHYYGGCGSVQKKLLKFMFLIPGALFVLLSIRYMNSPGLYMDAVNPDYLASWLLAKPDTQPAWIFPDNYLFGAYKYPLLNSLYGGNLLAYLGVLFFNIFGYGVYSVRLYHVFIGLLLVLSVYYFFKKIKAPVLWCLFGLVALACDPGFLLAWRTQYYLQLFPLIFFFFGIAIYFDESKIPLSRYRCFISGMLVGIAAWNYFIYIIYGVVFILFAFLMNSRQRRKEAFPVFILMGFCIGVMPYLYAHVSILLNVGFNGYLAILKFLQTSYGVVDTSQSIVARILYVAQRVCGVISGNDVKEVIFSEPVLLASWVFWLRVFLLLFLMVVFAGFYLYKKNHTHGEPVMLFVLVILAHLMLGLFVGHPLSTQHYIMLMPLLLTTLVLIIKDVFDYFSGKIVRRFVVIAATSFLAVSAYAAWSVTGFYKTENFKKYYSASINYAVEYVKSEPGNAVLLFPQWGYWMAFSTALGPDYAIAQTRSFDELMHSADIGSKVKSHQKVILIIGEEIPDPLDRQMSIESFKGKFNLKVEKIENFKRNPSEAGIQVAVFDNMNSANLLVQSLHVEDWGPKETTLGKVPNIQKNGDAGVWVKFKNAIDDGKVCAKIVSEQKCLSSAVDQKKGLITFALEKGMFGTRKVIPIEIVFQETNRSLFVGNILVK